MKIVKVKNYEHVSELAAAVILGKMHTDKRVNLSLTAGSSPRKAYELIVDRMAESTNYSDVHFYTFDGGPVEGCKHTNTYVEMKKMLYEPANIPEKNIHEITMQNFTDFDQEIKEAGELDLMVLGLGADGHFCGNMPFSTAFDKLSYEVEIKEELPWFDLLVDVYKEYQQNVPKSFVTMGPLSVLRAKQILLIVNGDKKAEAFKKMLKGPIEEDFPASILRLHKNITVVTDEAAAKYLD